MISFDIIIPLARKDVDFISRVVDYLTRCIEGVSHIYILTNAGIVPKAEKKLSSYSVCQIIDEDTIITGLTFQRVKELLKQSAQSDGVINKTGWYFQQLLKFGFSRSELCSKYYLSWDSDTLPLAPITFFEGEHILFNPKKEYNENYFRTIEKLFGYGKVFEDSFISENMMFSADIVRQMLVDLEKSDAEGNDWIEKILYACDFKTNFPAFSEFETYGSYCFVKHPNLYKQRHLNTFREAGLIAGKFISDKKLKILSFDIDIASFESCHEPLFPYNLPQIKERLIKIFKMTPKTIFSKLFRSEENIEIEKMLYRLPNKTER